VCVRVYTPRADAAIGSRPPPRAALTTPAMHASSVASTLQPVSIADSTPHAATVPRARRYCRQVLQVLQVLQAGVAGVAGRQDLQAGRRGVDVGEATEQQREGGERGGE
jgi:hypothetical protein